MDDTKIVQMYWERNEHAITATVNKYDRYCTAIAWNILSNAQDTEECVNDTYLMAWNTMPPHRPTILSAFLGKITRNLAFNKYKHAHREKRGGGEIHLVLEELAECVSDMGSVEETFDRQQLIREIDAFLARLPDKKRNIFVSRYWYADSVSDIARRYTLTENNVSVTLHRLRGALKNYLSERGFTL